MEENEVIINIQQNQKGKLDASDLNYMQNTRHPDYFTECNKTYSPLRYFYNLNSKTGFSGGGADNISELYEKLEDCLNKSNVKEKGLKVLLKTETTHEDQNRDVRVVKLEDFNYIKTGLLKEFVNVDGRYV